MTIIKPEFDRRSFVKAVMGGSAMGMLSPFAQQALAQSSGAKRIIFWYTPEGAAQQAFWPENLGTLKINPQASITNEKLYVSKSSIRTYVKKDIASYCLQPLAKHVGDISLYSGFQPRAKTHSSSDAHAQAIEAALTGGTPDKGSIDQILGPMLQGSAITPNIYLSMWGHHVKDHGTSSTYMSPVRTVNGRTLGSDNWNPMETYNSIFPGGVPKIGVNNTKQGFTDQQARMEILKAAAAELEIVRCVGGEVARNRMETILSSYETLEKKTKALIDADKNMQTGGQVDVSFDIPDGWDKTGGTRRDSSKYWNKSENFEKLMDIAIETTVAAFALDRTRVSTLQFSGSGTDAGPAPKDHYKKVGIKDLEPGDVNDHYMGHEETPSIRRNQARVFRWYYSKLAYLIDRLKQVPDTINGGTLFDNTLIVTCSEFSMFNHRNWDMPYMVIGSMGGKHTTGRYLDVYKNGFRHSADFFLGIAQIMGTNMTKFGESTNPYKFS